MPRLTRLSVHSDLECNSGAHLDELPDVLSARRTRRANGEGSLAVSFPRGGRGMSSVAVGAVLRLEFADATVEEWRLSQVDDASGGPRDVSVLAQRATYELATRDRLVRTVDAGVHLYSFERVNASPSSIVTGDILAALPAFWSLGTFEPTTPVSVAFDFDNPRTALQKVLDALARAGAPAEFDVEKRPGTAGYWLHVFNVSSPGVGSPRIETGKNLDGIKRTRRRDKFATRVVPRTGTGATIAAARWRVVSIVGLVVTLEAPETGGGPVGFDDQWNGAYLEKLNGTRTLITDSATGATHTVTVSDATNLSVGHRVRLVSDASGTDISELSVPGAPVIVRPLQVATLGEGHNWATNPVFARYAAGVFDAWTETDAHAYLTLTQATTPARFGEFSCKAVFAGTGWNQPSQIQQVVNLPTGAARPFAASVWVYSDTTVSSGISVANFALGITGASTVFFPASVAANTWARLDIVGVASTSVALTIAWYPNLATAINWTTYVGGALIVDGSELPASLIAGNERSTCWVRGNDFLANAATLQASYDVKLRNLHGRDPVAYPYDALALRQTWDVVDTELGERLSPRVLELEENLLEPIDARATLSTIPDEISGKLLGVV